MPQKFRIYPAIQGAPNEEYLPIKILANLNLGNYAVIDSTYDNQGNISNIYRHLFWFPFKEVRAGDFIRLYTGRRRGRKISWTNKVKTTTWLFYWGMEQCVWNNEGDAAVIARLYIENHRRI